ncbi:MAG: hypothetical protein KGQ61_11730 [Planctomycetes bacterium]|nr:hypothetical protein [Planctomycetota bacterium]
MPHDAAPAGTVRTRRDGTRRRTVVGAAIVLVGLGAATAVRAADAPATVTFVERFQRDELSPQVTAVGIRGPATPREADATQIVVLVDTSASQSGPHRRRALEAVEAFVGKCRPADRVFLAAVDLSCTPLSKRFDGPTGGDIKGALAALANRTPLGSTDLITGIDEAAQLFAPGSAQRTMVYVGDGPGLMGLEAAEYRRMLDGLRGRRISFSALGIGADVNWTCLAAIANATGGMLLVPEGATSPADAGARMAGLAAAPVTWPEDTLLSTNAADARVKLLPGDAPPLRGDRDSVLIAVGPLTDARLEFAVEVPSGKGLVQKQVTLALPDAESRSDNAFLEELARNAFDSAGIFLPTLGREGLDAARGVIRGEAATLATMSRQAERSGAHGSALRLAFAALRRDPDNAEAAVVFTAAQKSIADGMRLAQAGQPPAGDDPFAPVDPPAPAERAGDVPPRPAADPLRIEEPRQPLGRDAVELEPEDRPVAEPLPPAGTTAEPAEPWIEDADPGVEALGRPSQAAGEDLAAIARMRKVRAQRLEQETAVRLRTARQTCAIDPDRARLDLKELQRVVMSSDDLDPAVRDRLNRQIEIGIRDSIVRSRSKAEHDLAADRNRAIALERARLDGELRRREERFKQLTERYHALVEEGIRVGFQRPTDAFTEAERVVGKEMGEEASWLYANRGMPMAAREVAVTAPLVARILDYHAENTRVRRDQQRGFMDSLHLADVAAIPYPDEPPVIYPSAARWQEITRLREKYKSVDLANPGSAEKKIYDALEKPVESLEFSETPLRDVISQLQDSQGIPIQVDTKALEDAGLDLDAPVTRNLSGVSLRSALRLILGDLDMTYLVKDEVLLITTKEKAAEDLIVKVYPVADLVMPMNAAGGVNPFQGGGGMGGMGGGMGGMGGGMGGMGGGMGGMGGGMFQVSDAKSRIGMREKKPDTAATPAPRKPAPPADAPAATEATGSVESLGLPERIVEAADLDAAIAGYLHDGDRSDLGGRLARLRISAAELGRKGRFDRAAELIAAAIAAGSPEPWMYESLALALEAAGKPTADVERALLSSADFAQSPTELLALAGYLARFGSNRQALRLCRQVVRVDRANREAYALAMALAAKDKDDAALRWACAGVLAHEWPAAQQEVPTRAARLAKAAIERQRKEGRGDEADAFAADIDAALVRDVELEFSWNGDADIDVVVEEPAGTICSVANPRSISGGTLLADLDAGPDRDNGTHRERYIAAEAFPGRYHVLVHRTYGKVAADTVTAELILHRGTDREQRLRRQVPLGADDTVFSIDVPDGRRREPLLEAQIAQDFAAQQDISRAVLAQQLAGINDPAVAGSMSQGRGAAPGGESSPLLPFTRGGAAGYQPVISVLPEGTNLQATAVVSADRRYVRVSVTPLFSGVGQVTTFNFAGGGAMGTGGMGGGGMGGGGMGGGGMGGMGGGMGGMGGGMGGMGGGGMGGGMGGMGGMGGGGMGGGFCWVAREVYGADDPRWLLFREWLRSDAPRWLHDLYGREGERFAAWISDKPAAKAVVRSLMDAAIAPRLERP